MVYGQGWIMNWLETVWLEYMKLDLQTNLNEKDVRNGGVNNNMKVLAQANINCSNWINIEMIIFFQFLFNKRVAEFSNRWFILRSFSHVWLFDTLGTVTCQAPPSHSWNIILIFLWKVINWLSSLNQHSLGLDHNNVAGWRVAN